jgi:hypothetical protein
LRKEFTEREKKCRSKDTKKKKRGKQNVQQCAEASYLIDGILWSCFIVVPCLVS